MELLDIDVTNFLSVGHIHFNYKEQGLILVEGDNQDDPKSSPSNGAGKTSGLIEAVIYALFGKTLKDLSGDDVVNKKVGKGSAVVLRFTVGSLSCRIERYRKHKTYKNKVLFFINEEDHTQSSVKDTDKLIQDTLGIDFTTFINSIVFGQGSIKLFSQATDKERKEILEELAGLAIYKKAEDRAKELYKQTQDELFQEEQLYNQYSLKLDNLIEIEKSESEQYALFKKQYEGYDQKIEVQRTLINDQLQEATPMIENIDSKIVSIQKKLSTQERPKRKEYDQLKDELNSVYLDLSVAKRNTDTQRVQVKQLRDRYDSLSQSKVCPVCGNTLDEEHIKKEQLNIITGLQKLVVDYQEGQRTVDENSKVYNNLLTKQQQLVNAVQEEDEEYRKLISESEKLHQSKSALTAQLTQDSNTLESMVQEYARFKQVPSPKPKTEERVYYNKLREEVQGNKGLLQKDLDEYKQVIELYSNSGVKSHVLDLITPFLNERANVYLAQLSGSGMEVTFSTQKKNKDGTFSDKFDLEVVNSVGGDSYASCSQGEKRRVDLSISLAIQDLLLNKSALGTNVVFYDECFDGLDSVGCERVVELLKGRVKTVGSIYVITHNEALKALFDNVITVVKKDGISSIAGKEVTSV